MKKVKVINVLGTDYTVYRAKENEDPILKTSSGYTDPTTKTIVVCDNENETTDEFKNLKYFEEKTTRHEVIHAFLYESGLSSSSDWAENEEVVDWIAIQFPKIAEVFKKL
jgi:hypothetical protein